MSWHREPLILINTTKKLSLIVATFINFLWIFKVRRISFLFATEQWWTIRRTDLWRHRRTKNVLPLKNGCKRAIAWLKIVIESKEDVIWRDSQYRMLRREQSFSFITSISMTLVQTKEVCWLLRIQREPSSSSSISCLRLLYKTRIYMASTFFPSF